MEGWGLSFSRRRWKKGLGIFGKILAAIRTVKAFGKYNDICTSFGSLEDFGTGMGEVVSFVSACELCQKICRLSLTRLNRPENLPLANCTSASLTGFLSNFDIVATDAAKYQDVARLLWR